MQFLIYMLIGTLAAVENLISFLTVLALGVSLTVSTVSAFVLAAVANYFLCIAVLFRHKARWNSVTEVFVYLLVVAAAGTLDLGITTIFYATGMPPWLAKSMASVSGVVSNFLGRRFVIF